jgi:pyruvyltransferase
MHGAGWRPIVSAHQETDQEELENNLESHAPLWDVLYTNFDISLISMSMMYSQPKLRRAALWLTAFFAYCLLSQTQFAKHRDEEYEGLIASIGMTWVCLAVTAVICKFARSCTRIEADNDHRVRWDWQNVGAAMANVIELWGQVRSHCITWLIYHSIGRFIFVQKLQLFGIASIGVPATLAIESTEVLLATLCYSLCLPKSLTATSASSSLSSPSPSSPPPSIATSLLSPTLIIPSLLVCVGSMSVLIMIYHESNKQLESGGLGGICGAYAVILSTLCMSVRNAMMQAKRNGFSSTVSSELLANERSDLFPSLRAMSMIGAVMTAPLGIPCWLVWNNINNNNNNSNHSGNDAWLMVGAAIGYFTWQSCSVSLSNELPNVWHGGLSAMSRFVSVVAMFAIAIVSTSTSVIVDADANGTTVTSSSSFPATSPSSSTLSSCVWCAMLMNAAIVWTVSGACLVALGQARMSMRTMVSMGASGRRSQVKWYGREIAAIALMSMMVMYWTTSLVGTTQLQPVHTNLSDQDNITAIPISSFSNDTDYFIPDELKHWVPPPLNVVSTGVRNPKLHFRASCDCGKGNFGDDLTQVIVNSLSCRAVHWQTPRATHKLISLGSVMHYVEAGDTVWGTGVRRFADFRKQQTFVNVTWTAFRGPITRQVVSEKLKSLGQHVALPEVYGDPGMLLPYLYNKPMPIKYERITVAHKRHFDKMHKAYGHLTPVISADTPDWHTVVDAIRSAKIVFSSSLHGIIIAEAYGIPAYYINGGIQEGRFKFDDYYASTGRKLIGGESYLALAKVEDLPKWTAPVLDLAPLLKAFPFELCWEPLPRAE